MSNNDFNNVKAFILAGGKGTRLKPFTVVLPKPLVPLGEMSILEILLTRLGKFGFSDFVISTGYLSELIMAVGGDGSKFGARIAYCHEDAPLGTAGPLSLLDEASDPVVVMNGDLLTTLDFSKLLDFHEENDADITIATFRRDVTIDFGVVKSDTQGAFLGFQEKPTYEMDVSMGVNVLSKDVVNSIQSGKRLDMPDLIQSVAAEGGRVCCYKEDCYWLDIGRIDDYAAAQEQFDLNRTRFLEA